MLERPFNEVLNSGEPDFPFFAFAGPIIAGTASGRDVLIEFLLNRIIRE